MSSRAVITAYCVAAFSLHLFASLSIFGIWYRSPIVNGMSPQRSSAAFVPPAARVVVVSVDGARADMVYQGTTRDMIAVRDGRDPSGRAPTMPFVRSLLDRGVCWGVSHARVPTESRPGHVALLAGLYEDPSAVTTGWKSTRAAFDSLVNESTHAWQFGSRDIVPLFSPQGVYRHVDTQVFPDAMNDWTADPSEMDNWVFAKYATLLENATRDAGLAAALGSDGVVLFLHLLGVDSAGHMYRPDGRGYLETMANADRGLRQIVEMTDRYFRDGRTAFLVTADHGMTARGSHGDGSPEETRSPMVVWGAGIRNCSDGAEGIPAKILYTSVEEASWQAVDWGVRGAARQDIEQADVSPLLASLLGVAIPMNSRGVINLDLIGGPAPSRARAYMIDANVRQLLELLKCTAAVVSDRHVLFRPYRDAALPDPEEALRQMQECLAAADYDCAFGRGRALITYTSRALRYFQTYEWTLLLVLVASCYALFVVATMSLVSRSAGSGDFSRRVAGITFLCLVLVCALLGRQPIAFGAATIIALLLGYIAGDGGSWARGISPRASMVAAVVIEGLVVSYSYREGLAVLTLGMAVGRAVSSSRPPWVLMASAMCVAAFALMPVDVGRHTALAVAGCVVCTLYSLAMPHTPRPVNMMQSIAMVAMGVVIVFADGSVGRGDGLPAAAQASMWGLSALGVATAYRGHDVHTVVVGLLIPFCGMATAYESLFAACMAVFLREWVAHAHDTDTVPMTAVNTQAFITMAFFGFGNLASVSSFDVGCLFRFVAVFNHPLMLALLLVKIFIPLVMVVVEMAQSPHLAVPQSTGGTMPATFRLFCYILCCGDAMSLHFFFLLKDEGSWKDIGLSISRFVICSAEVLMLLILAVLCAPLLKKTTAAKRNLQ